MSKFSISCGTLVVNRQRQLLLCHVTHTAKWDIPKGTQDPGESTLETAMRELREEAGLAFAPGRFEDLGQFEYRRDKRLHLYKLESGDELTGLDHLACTSYFTPRAGGVPIPEMDAFRWAARMQMRALCWPRMAELLLSLDW